MTTSGVIEMVCEGCGHTLGEYVNRIQAGSVLFRRRCRHCKRMNQIEVTAATATE